MGPLRDVARQAGGALAEAVEGSREDLLVGGARRAARARRARGRGPALGRRRDARLRRAAGPPAAALARLPDRHLPARRCAPEVRRVLGRAAARVRAHGRARRAVGGGGRAAGAARRPRRRRPARHLRRQPVLRHRGAGRARRGAACRRACATPSPCARPPPGREARAVAELAAVVPGPGRAGARDRARRRGRRRRSTRCVEAGLLLLRGDALAFRHDLARRAVEDALSPLRRRELNALRAGGARGGGRARPGAARRTTPATPATPPRSAGSPPPRPARRPRRAGTGRRSSTGRPRSQAAGGADPEALEGVAVEAYLLRAHGARARGAPRAARAPRRGRRRRCAPARTSAGCRGSSGGRATGRGGTEAADRAIALLEAFPDSRELAMALSARSQLAMLDRAPRGGDRARHARRAARAARSATARPSCTR